MALGGNFAAMDRNTLAWASALLFIAVAGGAFGAHGLKPRIGADALGQWQTAIQYLFHHALALLVLSALAERLPRARLRLVRFLFLGGILLFCGSLLLLSTRELYGGQDLARVLGPITPLGGLLLLGGWAVLLITALRSSDVHQQGSARMP
jgi:uncharacterized membrane protein YgdD (TMEM256/DUF423 family)